MQKLFSFESRDLIGEVTPSNTIILSGDPSTIRETTKFLTVINNNIIFQKGMLEKKLKRLLSSMVFDSLAVEDLQKEINELSKDEKVEFFFLLSATSIEVPFGFWFLAKNRDELSLTRIKRQPFPEGVIQPRFYQIEAVEHLLSRKRAMVELATGLGKTVLLVDLINSLQYYYKNNIRIMVVVPTVELMKQTLNFIKKYFPDACGLGGSGKYANKYKNGCSILVGVINSCIQYSDRFNAIIIDETHHAASMMYNKLVMYANNCNHVYGLTATPCRADGLILGVHANCGPVVFRRTTSWGVENNFLCPSIFRMMYIRGEKTYLDTSVMEVKAYGYLIRSRKVIKTVIDTVRYMLGRNKKILFLTKHVKPSEVFAEALSAELGFEIKAAHASFRHPLEQFKKGETTILVANDDLCGEGVDIPDVDCMFNLTQRSSESKIRQILGRGLRIKEGKERLIFFDVVLLGYGHNESKKDGQTVWMDRYMNSSKRRRAIYEEIGEVGDKTF